MLENRPCDLYDPVIDRLEIIRLGEQDEHFLVDKSLYELEESKNKMDRVKVCVFKFKLNMNRMRYCAQCCSVHCVATNNRQTSGENVSQRVHSLLGQVKRFTFQSSDSRRAISRLGLTKKSLTSNITAQRVSLLKWLDEKEKEQIESVNIDSATFTRVIKYLEENENELTTWLDRYTSHAVESPPPSETFTLKSKIYAWNSQLDEKQKDLDTYLFRNVRRLRFVLHQPPPPTFGFVCFNTFYF